jgi:hypothetical protein
MSSSQQPHRIWFIDGVSCLGKTSFVHDANSNGLKLDYAERTGITPFFRQKATSHIAQILYTATFGLEVIRRIDELRGLGLVKRTELQTTAVTASDSTLYVDRSPISDIWYELLFKHYDDQEKYEQTFAWIDQLDVFASLPTVFIVPDACHAARICEQMRVRSNGLDCLSVDYVLQQINVFDRVIERFGHHPNVRVIRIGPDQRIFSEEYFLWIRKRFYATTHE